MLDSTYLIQEQICATWKMATFAETRQQAVTYPGSKHSALNQRNKYNQLSSNLLVVNSISHIIQQQMVHNRGCDFDTPSHISMSYIAIFR